MGEYVPTGPSLLTTTLRAGVLTAYARKIAAELVVGFSSLVSFASLADSINTLNIYSASTWYSLVVGIVSFLYIIFLLTMGYCTETTRDSSWFSPRFEMQLLLFLVIWWIPGLGFICNVRTVQSGVGIVFSWIAFVASIYGTYQAFNAWQDFELNRKGTTRQQAGSVTYASDYADRNGFDSAPSESDQEIEP
mmetsp:Transcript_6717/g.12002  ORF Transcript_6717/g.12002 Transcript_6717/m.12002 type:complete len:192 (-) Transcript_6717:1382-1957(-)